MCVRIRLTLVNLASLNGTTHAVAVAVWLPREKEEKEDITGGWLAGWFRVVYLSSMLLLLGSGGRSSQLTQSVVVGVSRVEQLATTKRMNGHSLRRRREEDEEGSEVK